MIDLKQIKLPTNILVAGSTGSGKSRFILDHLLPALKGQYDVLVIVSPTLKVNHDYDGYEEDEETIFKIDEKINEAIAEMIDTQKKFYKQAEQGFIKEKDIPSVLIILDDCLNHINTNKVLNKFSIMSRHYKMSWLITTQRLASIPRQLRINCSHMFAFSMLNYSEFERIGMEYIPKKYHKGFQERLLDAYQEPYNFIYFNCKETNPLLRVITKQGKYLLSDKEKE